VRRARIACAAAALVALGGCINLQPRYERPAAPVAAQFPFAPAASAPAAPDWQAFFADPRLDRLIDIALANNRDLRVAVINIEAARAQLGLRRADQLPTVNLAATGSRTAPANANGGVTSVYTVGLAVSSFELDLFGRVRSLSDAALAQLAATEEARKAAQIALVSSVANAYVAMAADDALIDIAQRTVGTRDESLKLTQLRFDNGVVSDFDLQTARSALEAAKVALAAAQRQRATDQNALELLLGQPLPAALPAAHTLATMQLPDLPAGLPSEVLLRRPDVRQAEQQLIAANASIGAARAAFFPHITLTGSAGTASVALSKLFQNTAWSFAPALVQPLFDAGRNRSNLQASEAARDIAVAQYEKSVQSAFRDVADALAGRATFGEQLRAQQAQADAEGVRFRLSTLRYDNGVASSLELLDAQRSLFLAQQAVVQAQLALLQNRITMYRSLGGGWPAASS